MNTESTRAMITELPGLLAVLNPRAGRHLVQHVRAILSAPFDPLAARAKLAEHIHACTENGKVAIVSDGMDCDCVRSCHSSLRVAAPFAIEREVNEIHESAEGPVSVCIVKPSEAPENWSRDLALEAFEDGHPHVVYA